MAEDPVDGTIPEDDGRPEWLPEKFKTPEDMARSYAEAERKISETTAQLGQYQEAYTDASSRLEQLEAAQGLPDPAVAQNWLEEQWETNPLQTVAQLATQAAQNAVQEQFKQYQQQAQPAQQGQLQTAAALADYEMQQLYPDWQEYRGKVTEIIQQFPHLVPEAHLSNPLDLRQDLTQVYQLARSQDLEQKAQTAEQRATELEQMKINAQTTPGSMGRPMAPDAQKAEWEIIMNATPGGYKR